MQDDFKWGSGVINDMCEEWSSESCQGVTHLEDYDVQTWQRLDPQLVVEGEIEELGRLQKISARVPHRSGS